MWCGHGMLRSAQEVSWTLSHALFVLPWSVPAARTKLLPVASVWLRVRQRPKMRKLQQAKAAKKGRVMEEPLQEKPMEKMAKVEQQPSAANGEQQLAVAKEEQPSS